jgi:hypothetical protein
MKEIDFLPIWYKNSRRKQIGYRTQYAGIGGIFLAMVIWSFIAMRSLSETGEELAKAELKSTVAEKAAHELAAIRDEAVRLQGKARIIKEIDSKIDVASVLGEISYLVDGRIALSKVEFVAEKFGDGDEGRQNGDTTVMTVAGKFGGEEALPLGDIRFKVLINGIASDASDVAALICKLEDSPYFCKVIPLFVCSKEMKTSTNEWGEEFQVSEFEIRCNLANYRQEEPYFAKGAQKRKAAGL